ncbi:vitamin B12 ABC transporter substrate-binding protein BtuF [Vibrio sp. Isolate24]|uniref:vitamin B12 ABC transporter substrate-binding protein BtuF n=1 Tax=Vibrio sp. Isolate24 TaxID=2908534 RepID=UPI001EFE427F|nr:vitamin B12 ABC transporter substrate-binding protein BtuF [Vibrio sp. Isolate24]MCG9679988.1 vitamin B12 ABC transporter substrate-binding protein BtuF [Vibrio sp. Isolate24]
MTRLSLILFLLFPTFSHAEPAKRVISLAPHATEMAFAAGLGDKLIAVSEHSDYPEQAKEIEKVSNYQGIKLERIIALQPDLVIAWPAGNPPRELEKLKQFGLNIYFSTTNSLDDIAKNIEQLSKYAENPSIGIEAGQLFRAQLAEFKQRYQTEIPVSYFYQLSEQPMITVAKRSWPSEVFSFCGGINVFESSSAPYPQVSTEQVVLKNPDVIFTSQSAIANTHPWNKWNQQLSAVKNHHVWSLNSNWLNRPTQRTLNAIEEVCEHFDTVRRNR